VPHTRHAFVFVARVEPLKLSPQRLALTRSATSTSDTASSSDKIDV
jgi:hypothetical protein